MFEKFGAKIFKIFFSFSFSLLTRMATGLAKQSRRLGSLKEQTLRTFSS